MNKAESPVVARQSQVGEQLNCLDKNLCELSGLVDDLERMLGAVLRDDEPTPNGAVSPQDVLVPHADMIRNAHQRVAYASGCIRSVINRLEL